MVLIHEESQGGLRSRTPPARRSSRCLAEVEPALRALHDAPADLVVARRAAPGMRLGDQPQDAQDDVAKGPEQDEQADSDAGGFP